MVKLSVVHTRTGPLENYGLEESLGTPHIEDEFRYTGPKTNEIFDNFGGTSIGNEDEIPTEKGLKESKKYIVLDLKNIEQKIKMPKIKGFKFITFNPKVKNALYIKLNSSQKESFLKEIKPYIFISNQKNNICKFAKFNVFMEGNI
ncbi:MAG: hypothetical protein QXK49_03640 [Candidatus Aenigmatarchaeota archaeon]